MNALVLYRRPPEFAELSMRARRAIAHAARTAHPVNPEHRRRWVRARMTLYAENILPRCPVGKGQMPARTINQLRQWERAARMVC